MAKTKQEQIDRLQEELEKTKGFKNRIESLFWDDINYYSEEDIIIEIKKLQKNVNYYKSEKQRREKELIMNNELLRDEISRLWYLLRAMIDDKTLKNEVSNYVKPIGKGITESPFDRPNF